MNTGSSMLLIRNDILNIILVTIQSNSLTDWLKNLCVFLYIQVDDGSSGGSVDEMCGLTEKNYIHHHPHICI